MEGELVVHEAATDVFHYRQALGHCEPWLLPDIQENITSLQLQRESLVAPSRRFFIDRSVIDGAAYLMLLDYPRSEKAFDQIASANVRRYNKKVFLIENSGENTAVDGNALKIENVLRLVYTNLGYEVIDVPYLPISERIAIIRNAIQGRISTPDLNYVKRVLKNRDYLKWSSSEPPEN